MLRYVIVRQTGSRLAGAMEPRTTITYYELTREVPYLAIARYTAYGEDKMPVKICEDIYADTPEEFCRLERDVETALLNGIDASILSAYEHEIFPVISSYLA